mgnify:CR=1 FL=1
MKIIGLNHGEINSSAAFYKNGLITHASPEERFSRQKKTKQFPHQSIDFLLKKNNCAINDIDFFSQSWNPGANWCKYNPLYSSHRSDRAEYFYSIPDNLHKISGSSPKEWVKMSFPEGNGVPDIYFVQHHLCHAANAFFLSPFDNAAILTCDWRGEFECCNFGIGQGTSIEIFKKQFIPHSLGMFYATFTELLGYRSDSDEWRVMALSAYDVDDRDFTKKIRSTVKLLDNGSFELDQSYYKGALLDQPKLYTNNLVELLGGREGKGLTETDEWSLKVASSMQNIAEEIALNMLNFLHRKTGLDSVCLAGGFFMNSVFNGKIAQKTKFKNVYVSFDPTDCGNSIGSAYYTAHCILGQDRAPNTTLSYLGPEFSDQEIEAVLKRRGLAYEKKNDISMAVAELLHRDEIVANFMGRMEYGERALGNRSILANPSNPNVKDRINSMIKYRESYRPFAPVCHQEKSHLYFDVDSDYECLFMEKVIPVRKKYRKSLAAITHVDGSGRLQTIKREQNKLFYDLISKFEKLSNLPIVLNTSFNINGEPIACSPDDALNTFYNSGLKYLRMGNFLLKKF